jgi:predicted nuclease with TOPRIM domain
VSLTNFLLSVPRLIINYHQLLLRLQDKDQLISNYVTENLNLISSLTAAETRVNDLYAEQSRWEMELAQRLDISEKLRDQVRDLEREKRDVQRRYNEQVGNSTGDPASFLRHSLDRYLRRRATGIL